MKKLGILLLALIMVVGSVGCGAETENKETTKKEAVKKESVEDTVDEEAEEETVEEEKAETSVSEGETADTQAGASNSTTTAKTETNNNKNNTSNNTTNKVTSSTKPSQTVTQPTTGHVHNWTEVTEVVAVPETGHYEKVAGWVWFCTVCGVNADDWTNEEKNAHTFGDECPGKIDLDYKNIGEKWVVDTPATTESRVVGYKCSCGTTREKTQYAGMYSNYDKVSWDRINACYQFFKQGLAGADTQISGAGTFLPYGNWESVVVSNGSSDGAWMWIFIRDWKLDDYSYLQDGVKEGIIDQEEAKMVEALYEEIPSIFKGAIERVAPQGGTELYNYVLKLINQTGGDLDAVPSLAGAKGIIPENIPGLYVTIEETRGGFSLMFWAE